MDTRVRGRGIGVRSRGGARVSVLVAAGDALRGFKGRK